MNAKPHIVIANGSCWDVYAHNKTWLAEQSATFESDAGYHLLSSEEFENVLRKADGAVGPWGLVTSQLMEKCEKLKVISFASSGYDNIDLDEATRKGIVVTNAPVAELSESVADLTIGFMLATARKIPQHHNQVCAGDHSRGLDSTLWRKTLGIVGLGAIGRAVARRAVGFEMRLLASEPFPDESFVADHQIELVDLEVLLQQSDFVSLHVRLTLETKFMIGRRELERMQPSAVIINTARQDLINEQELAEALIAGHIAGAGLDDPPHDAASPLLHRADVVLMPHQGNRTRLACNAILRQGVLNALAVLNGQRPGTVLNPEVYNGSLRAVRPAGT